MGANVWTLAIAKLVPGARLAAALRTAVVLPLERDAHARHHVDANGRRLCARGERQDGASRAVRQAQLRRERPLLPLARSWRAGVARSGALRALAAPRISALGTRRDTALASSTLAQTPPRRRHDSFSCARATGDGARCVARRGTGVLRASLEDGLAHGAARTIAALRVLDVHPEPRLAPAVQRALAACGDSGFPKSLIYSSGFGVLAKMYAGAPLPESARNFAEAFLTTRGANHWASASERCSRVPSDDSKLACIIARACASRERRRPRRLASLRGRRATTRTGNVAHRLRSAAAAC